MSAIALICFSGSASVGRFCINDDGALVFLDETALPGVDCCPPMAMVVSIDRRRLYIATRKAPFCLMSFVMAEGGRLVFDTSVSLPAEMCDLRLNARGDLLSMASFNDDGFAVCALSADGRPDRDIVLYPTRQNPHCAVEEPSGDFLVACLGADALVRYCLQGGNAIAVDQTPLQPGSGPRELSISHDGGRLFVAAEQAGNVMAFDRDAATGSLALAQTVELLPGTKERATGRMMASPDGQWLFVSERGSNTVVVFAINERARLTRLGAYPTPAEPRGLGVTPDSRHVIVLGKRDGVVSCYRVATDGQLSQTFGSVLGARPSWVECLAI